MLESTLRSQVCIHGARLGLICRDCFLPLGGGSFRVWTTHPDPEIDRTLRADTSASTRHFGSTTQRGEEG